MGVEHPDLDDIEHEELLAEATSLIDTTDEQWTDLDPHDPGITVVELLAWLTESYAYQLDTVTDDHREKFLSLLGTATRPPTRASAWLSLSSPEPVTIPAGTRLRASTGTGAAQAFETDRPVSLTDAEVCAVRTMSDGAVTDHTDANGTEGLSYRAFGDEPTAGDALCLGFDRDPFAGGDTVGLTVRHYDGCRPDTADGGSENRFTPSVDLDWDCCVGDRPTEEAAWTRLPVVRDGTDRLHGTGTVVLGRPAEFPRTAPRSTGEQTERYWIRCRVRQADYEIPPQFEAVETNLVPVSHGVSVDSESLHRTPGSPPALNGQRFEFPREPIQSATVTVDGDPYEAVPDFDSSAPDDSHYVLDRTDGVVTFGGGRRGAAPNPDATVRATAVEYGGGETGNVPADAHWRIASEATIPGPVSSEEIDVVPRTAASGGTDAESIEACFERISAERQRPARAVTAEDYETLAETTPGIRVDRCAVVVDGTPGITVVVVPPSEGDCERPRPSDGSLDAIERHLDDRRLLADQVRVTGPSYVDIDVAVTVVPAGVQAAVDRAATVRATIEERLGAWPIGRGVARSTVRAWTDEAGGVEAVRGIDVNARGDASVETTGWIDLGPRALPRVGEIDVTVRPRHASSGGQP